MFVRAGLGKSLLGSIWCFPCGRSCASAICETLLRSDYEGISRSAVKWRVVVLVAMRFVGSALFENFHKFAHSLHALLSTCLVSRRVVLLLQLAAVSVFLRTCFDLMICLTVCQLLVLWSERAQLKQRGVAIVLRLIILLCKVCRAARWLRVHLV